MLSGAVEDTFLYRATTEPVLLEMGLGPSHANRRNAFLLKTISTVILIFVRLFFCQCRRTLNTDGVLLNFVGSDCRKWSSTFTGWCRNEQAVIKTRKC